MITRGERRRLTNRIIRKRKRKILTILHRPSWCIKDPFKNGEIYEGELRNNNIMNMYSCGWSRKTKARKACANYRHHGAYGVAKYYMHHDKKQIEDGKIQLKEFKRALDY